MFGKAYAVKGFECRFKLLVVFSLRFYAGCLLVSWLRLEAGSWLWLKACFSFVLQFATLGILYVLFCLLSTVLLQFCFYIPQA